MIDIVVAMDAVMDAVARATSAAPRGRRTLARRSLAEAAVSLAIPAARRPSRARALVAELRRDPWAAAEAWDCTLGAVLVWRAVDRAERAGASPIAAAEAGLTGGLKYVDLMPERLTGSAVASRA